MQRGISMASGAARSPKEAVSEGGNNGLVHTSVGKSLSRYGHGMYVLLGCLLSYQDVKCMESCSATVFPLLRWPVMYVTCILYKQSMQLLSLAYSYQARLVSQLQLAFQVLPSTICSHVELGCNGRIWTVLIDHFPSAVQCVQEHTSLMLGHESPCPPHLSFGRTTACTGHGQHGTSCTANKYTSPPWLMQPAVPHLTTHGILILSLRT